MRKTLRITFGSSARLRSKRVRCYNGGVMANKIYPRLSYTVQGVLMDVFREFHVLEISEKWWERAFLIALREWEIEAQSQVEYASFYNGLRMGRSIIVSSTTCTT